MLPLKAWLSGVPCAEDVSTDVVNDNDIARPNMNNDITKENRDIYNSPDIRAEDYSYIYQLNLTEIQLRQQC
jgi:hypothetical protein